MQTHGLTVATACQLLGLDTPAAADRLSAAFRRAAKAAHPDTTGGNVEQFRRVIDAYHLLQTVPASMPTAASMARPAVMRRPAQDLPPLLVITPLQALHGGSVVLRTGGRRLLVHTPPGIRSGDNVRLDVIGKVPVMIRPDADMSVLGGDLFVTCRVASRFIRDGGRIEIETPHGPQSAWLVPDMVEPVRLCFKGLGLPARGKRRAGDMFVKLAGCDDMPSAAEHMLDRFNRVWTGDSVAA